MGYLRWFLMVFITSKLIVLKKIERIFQIYCFCSLLSKCFQALLWTGPISFLVKCEFFCLLSVLSDAILSLLLSFVL